MDIFGVPLNLFFLQLFFGLTNGCFYVLLSLGLTLVFGMLRVINFSHGAIFTLGGTFAWAAQEYFAINYWLMLLLAPIVIGIFGVVIERVLIRRIYGLDDLYSVLLTLGLTLIIDGAIRSAFGVAGHSYEQTTFGTVSFGPIMVPLYRLWVVVFSLLVWLVVWLLIEKTRLGSYLRAGVEDSELVGALGINISTLTSLTFGLGMGLAGLAGVLAAPIKTISPVSGENILVVVFAVVVIGGMDSMKGTLLAGIGLGLVESLVKIYYPEASSVIIFVIMGAVLLLRKQEMKKVEI